MLFLEMDFLSLENDFLKLYFGFEWKHLLNRKIIGYNNLIMIFRLELHFIREFVIDSRSNE